MKIILMVSMRIRFSFEICIVNSDPVVDIHWLLISTFFMCRGEWQYLVDRFTLNDRYLGRLIPVITETFTSELKLKEVSVVCFANILRP